MMMITTVLRACCGLALMTAVPSWASTAVTDVSLQAKQGRVDVVIVSDQPVTYQTFQELDPPTVVVDLLEATAPKRQLAGLGLVKGVRVSTETNNASSRVRLRIELNNLRAHDVVASGNRLVVSIIDAPVASASLIETASARVASAGFGDGEMGRATATDAPIQLAQAGTRQMTFIGFRNVGGVSKLYARLNDKADYVVRKEGDNQLVLEIQNATIPLRNNRNHLDTTFFDSPIKMITPSEVESATPTIRIVIELRQAVPFKESVEGRDIVLSFSR
jgi:AMIN domain